MKISVLTPNFSNNCVGRAYLLAKILQRHYKVEIIGPIWDEGIWQPVVEDESILYKPVKCEGRLRTYWRLKELLKEVTGDVVYASKPLFASFGVGLLKKIFDGKPLVLDIDDWQMGFVKEYYRNLSFAHRFKFLASSVIRLYSLNSYWSSFIGEKLVPLADEITVSNTFLKEKFGGTIIWHARDTSTFNPEEFDKDRLREKYGIKKKKRVVMFLGSPRPYKGIENLIEAISLIKERSVILVIVGIGKDSYSQSLVKFANKKLAEERCNIFGLQSFGEIPEFLTIADVVVISQKRSFGTIGQLPAKVFDAMAMAKPIIATKVSDLPEILNDCGWLVNPDNPEELAKKISYVFNNPGEAMEKGWKAREKCIEKYSLDAMEKVLVKEFDKFK